MKRHLPVILLLFLMILACSCTNIKAPNTSFSKYEITQIGLTKADIAFLFDIENPNNIPIGFKDINYTIELDGKGFLSGTYEGFSMQAKEKKCVSIPVEVNYSLLLAGAANVVKKFIMKDDSIKYKLEGQASIVDNVGFSARVPFNADGEIKFF